MPLRKDNSLAVALIGAAAVVTAALIGYFATHQNKTDQIAVDYTVKVKDAQSHNPIVGAKVNLSEEQKAPQSYYADSDGIVYLRLSKDTKTITLEVTSSGYQNYSRSGLTVHTGSQDVFLEPLHLATTKTSALLDAFTLPVFLASWSSNGQKDDKEKLRIAKMCTSLGLNLAEMQASMDGLGKVHDPTVLNNVPTEAKPYWVAAEAIAETATALKYPEELAKGLNVSVAVALDRVRQRDVRALRPVLPETLVREYEQCFNQPTPREGLLSLQRWYGRAIDFVAAKAGVSGEQGFSF